MTVNASLSNPPVYADRRADQWSFFWIACFFSAFVIVDILSQITELERSPGGADPAKFAIYEISSVAVIIGLFPLLAWAVTRATPGQHSWREFAIVHVPTMLVFSFVHIVAMVWIRKLVFLTLFDAPYHFSNNFLRDFIYEMRKDAITYALVVFFITFGRQLAQQRRELAAAREDAKTTKRLTLKCGGRSIWVNAADVRWAKSASNYVEVAANGKTHLARSTLTAMEDQLRDAGANAVRVHRSHVVNLDHVREIKPTGQGDVVFEMSDGELISGSRRYRNRLPAV